MPIIKIASFNIEWMNDWFTPDAQAADFLPSFTKDGHTNDTDTTARRAARLIREIDPDILAVQEGPSREEEMALFINRYLSNDAGPIYNFFLSDSGRSQKPALLYKSRSVDSIALAPSSDIQMLINEWLVDRDGDEHLEPYQFTRLPLVLNASVGGGNLQIIVLHTKSYFVNQGQALWENPATRQDYIHAALENRRRNSAEAMRVRQYVDTILKNDPQSNILVAGDLNDGPGMDYFEELYLTHNMVDILVGSAFEPELIFNHAQHDVPAAERFTAVFDDFVTGENNKKIFLDHVLLSPSFMRNGNDLTKIDGSGTIHHTEYENLTDNNGSFREDRPSDHRPVSVQLQY